MFAEFEPVGVELGTERAVEAYDHNQGTSRARDDALLDALGVAEGTTFVDLGTGTGSLPIRAALRGANAHAVDVSTNMLHFVRRRASEAGVALEIHKAGFLSYRHEGPPADVVTTRSALHQLPDTWKQVALNNVASMLAVGGRFFLQDAIWSFPPAESMEMLPAWVERSAKPPGEGFTRDDFETHLREEFSTFSWILEEMIERAGLTISEVRHPEPWYGEILAAKPGAGTPDPAGASDPRP
ncbi:MAG: methyltransferase domain-containing protein [Myxococcota bacterium]|nr:methyltransferase domain-containing protein [Myxococcota bacterium]